MISDILLRDFLCENDQREEIICYLHNLYAGAFTEEAIGTHLENHVGFAFANYAIDVLRIHSKPGDRVLDIGAGFGSCVIAAREAGFDAFGVEVAPFEVEFARRRLKRIRPGENPDSVFLLGDATRLDIPSERVDAVTFWNVLEHIPDCRDIIHSADRLLKPGGMMYILCPNYNAWRLEAHYHVPWKPELRRDRVRAASYLRSLGRDPKYFETSIFCRTNWEILGLVRQLRYELYEMGNLTPLSLRAKNLRHLLRQSRLFLRFYNPFKESVSLVACKPAVAS